MGANCLTDDRVQCTFRAEQLAFQRRASPPTVTKATQLVGQDAQLAREKPPAGYNVGEFASMTAPFVTTGTTLAAGPSPFVDTSP